FSPPGAPEAPTAPIPSLPALIGTPSSTATAGDLLQIGVLRFVRRGLELQRRLTAGEGRLGPHASDGGRDRARPARKPLCASLASVAASLQVLEPAACPNLAGTAPAQVMPGRAIYGWRPWRGLLSPWGTGGCALGLAPRRRSVSPKETQLGNP